MRRLKAFVLGCAALLNGCHHNQKATGHGTVSGQIMPGSITDDMLPYASVKSTAPLAPAQPIGQTDHYPSHGGADEADTAQPAISDTAASPASAKTAVSGE